MGSTGRAQAALFAAIAMVLLTGYYLVDDFALIGDATALFLLGSVVPSIVWAAFFFVVYRSSPSARTVTWMTLLLAVLLEGVVDYIRFQESVSYWDAVGQRAQSVRLAAPARMGRVSHCLRARAGSQAYAPDRALAGDRLDTFSLEHRVRCVEQRDWISHRRHSEGDLLACADYTCYTNHLLAVPSSFLVDHLGESRAGGIH